MNLAPINLAPYLVASAMPPTPVFGLVNLLRVDVSGCAHTAGGAVVQGGDHVAVGGEGLLGEALQ